MAKKTILIVDDEPGITFLLEELLGSIGYETNVALTGLEAIKLIGENVYDLIILDYQLPIKNGLAVISETSTQGIKTPVIMMTGISEKIEMIIENIDRIDGLLKKPFDIQDVIDLVKEKIHNYEMQQ